VRVNVHEVDTQMLMLSMHANTHKCEVCASLLLFWLPGGFRSRHLPMSICGHVASCVALACPSLCNTLVHRDTTSCNAQPEPAHCLGAHVHIEERRGCILHKRRRHQASNQALGALWLWRAWRGAGKPWRCNREHDGITFWASLRHMNPFYVG
jgi:hypothetical protein